MVFPTENQQPQKVTSNTQNTNHQPYSPPRNSASSCANPTNGLVITQPTSMDHNVLPSYFFIQVLGEMKHATRMSVMEEQILEEAPVSLKKRNKSNNDLSSLSPSQIKKKKITDRESKAAKKDVLTEKDVVNGVSGIWHFTATTQRFLPDLPTITDPKSGKVVTLALGAKLKNMKPTIKERFEWLVRSRQFCNKERRENVEKLASLRATLGDDDFFSHTVLVDSSFEVVGKLETEDSEIPADIKETFKNVNTITVKIYNLVKNFYTNCRQQDRARLTVNTKQQQRVMKSAALFKCRACSNMLQLWERDGMVQPNGEVKAKRCFRCAKRRRESERLKRDQVREEGICCSRHINIPFQLVDNGRRRACLGCGNDRLNGCQKSLETCACTVQRMDSVQCTRCKIDLSGMVSIGGSIHHLIFGCPEAKKTFRNTRSFHSCQAHKECVNKLGGKCLVCQLDYKDLDANAHRVIHIHHVDKDGAEQRKLHGGSFSEYRKILKEKVDLNKYQVLCAGCHMWEHADIEQLLVVNSCHDAASIKEKIQKAMAITKEKWMLNESDWLKEHETRVNESVWEGVLQEDHDSESGDGGRDEEWDQDQVFLNHLCESDDDEEDELEEE